MIYAGLTCVLYVLLASLRFTPDAATGCARTADIVRTVQVSRWTKDVRKLPARGLVVVHEAIRCWSSDGVPSGIQRTFAE